MIVIDGRDGIQAAPTVQSSLYFMMNDNPMIGAVRYSGSSFEYQVFNGTQWMSAPKAMVSLSLDPNITTALDWVREKMSDEQRIKEYAEKIPAVKSLIEEKESIESKIKMLINVNA